MQHSSRDIDCYLIEEAKMGDSAKDKVSADSHSVTEIEFRVKYDQQMTVCKNNLYLNCALSALLLLLNILPYVLPWSKELSSVRGDSEYKRLYISLFQVWVPQPGDDIASVKMPLYQFLSSSCPGLSKTEHLCSSFQSCLFASYGYVPLKILSQLVHALNLLNAIRVVRTDLKHNRDAWLQQIQTYLNRLNVLGLNCRRQQQRFKMQAGFALAALLFYVICSGLISTLRHASAALYLDLVFSLVLPCAQSYHYGKWQRWHYQTNLAYYYGLEDALQPSFTR